MKQKKKTIKKTKAEKLFLLSWKRFFLVVIGFFVFVFLHNLIYALTNIEEAFFFILALIVPVYFLISLFYSLVYFLVKGGK